MAHLKCPSDEQASALRNSLATRGCFWENQQLVKTRKTVRKRPRRPASMLGISRIDQPEKHTHGWFVRLTRQGRRHTAFFADRKHGGKARALVEAEKGFAALFRKFGRPAAK